MTQKIAHAARRKRLILHPRLGDFILGHCHAPLGSSPNTCPKTIFWRPYEAFTRAKPLSPQDDPPPDPGIHPGKVNSFESDRPVEMLTIAMKFFACCYRATNREIADNLHIAENTVKSHVHNILENPPRSRSEACTLPTASGRPTARTVAGRTNASHWPQAPLRR